jgi:hypothetical protein
VGRHDAGTITDCYSTGIVSGEDYTGGFTGGDLGIITGCYFNNSQPDNGFGTPKSTADMQKQSTYGGWDFADIWNITAGINSGYPYLRNNTP